VDQAGTHSSHAAVEGVGLILAEREHQEERKEEDIKFNFSFFPFSASAIHV